MRAKAVGCGLIIVGLLIGSNLWAGEDDIRTAFAALQKAIKARDPDKIWALIDTGSQTDAKQKAKAVQAAFAKLGDKDKAEFEKKYGLTAKELADMNGKLFIKSNRFHNKYHEVPDSKIETVSVKGDKAIITYIEEDLDKVKIALVRQKGEWRFIVPMPKAVD